MPGCSEYKNVPLSIGAIVSSGKASLVELQTVLGVRDLYNLLEIIAIDNSNARIAQATAKKSS